MESTQQQLRAKSRAPTGFLVPAGILTLHPHLPTLNSMEVTLSPDLQARLDRISAETGRSRTAFIEDALTGYLDDLQPIRETLDSRYDDIKEGRVKLIPGEEVVARLKARNAAFRAARS